LYQYFFENKAKIIQKEKEKHYQLKENNFIAQKVIYGIICAILSKEMK
jgi:hypothetical protein